MTEKEHLDKDEYNLVVATKRLPISNFRRVDINNAGYPENRETPDNGKLNTFESDKDGKTNSPIE